MKARDSLRRRLKQLTGSIGHYDIGWAETGKFDPVSGGLYADPAYGLDTGYVWVRRGGARNAEQARNPGNIAPLDSVNESVIVGKSALDNELEVVAPYFGRAIPQHGANVYNAFRARATIRGRDLEPGRVYLAEVGTLKFRAKPFLFRDTANDRREWLDVLTSAVTASNTTAAGEHQVIVIALNPDATTPALVAVADTPVSTSASLTRENAAAVALTSGYIPLAGVHLYYGDTTPRGDDHIWDLRPWLEGGSASGGDFLANGSVPMTGDIDLADNAILAEELSATPATPATGKWKLYFRPTGLFIVDDAGTTTGPFIDNSIGGISTTETTNAGKPAAGNTGNLALLTDRPLIERDDGVAWQPWGPINRLTPPPIASAWTWVNQGGASLTDDAGSLLLTVPTNTGDSLRTLVKAAPSTPYTITALVEVYASIGNTAFSGLVFRESATSEIVGFGLNSSGNELRVMKWTNSTTYSADYTLTYLPLNLPALMWLRITDNGTNRISSISVAGGRFVTVHSVGRTDFLTANQVGFYLNVNSAVRGSAMRILSWKES